MYSTGFQGGGFEKMVITKQTWVSIILGFSVVFLVLWMVSADPVIETVYINNTVIVNHTVYEEVEVIKYVDKVVECKTEVCVQNFDASYVSNIIRDIDSCRYERNLLNNTDLLDIVYNQNISLDRCEDKLERIEEII